MIKCNFSRDEIIEKCEKAIETPWSFYNERFVKHDDGTKGEPDVYRTEIIAEFVLENIDIFKNNIPVHRREDYYVKHDGRKTGTNQIEKDLAKELFTQSEFNNIKYDFIGTVKNYEVPMRVDGNDKGFQAFDLLSVNEDDATAYILELKKKDSSESMLRCVLESFTYLKVVCKENLFDSYGIPSGYNLIASPFVFYGGVQWKQMIEVNNGVRPKLNALIKELGVKPFYLVGPTSRGEYSVLKEQ